MSYEFFLQLIKRSIAHSEPLENIENYVAASSPNWTNPQATYLEIDVANISSFEHWNPSNGHWIIRRNNENVTHPLVVALIIPADDKRPLARVYSAQLSLQDAAVFLLKKEKEMTDVMDVTSQDELDKLVDAPCAAQRIRDYQNRYTTPAQELEQEFLEGRMANTFVTAADVLDSGGSCLLCEKGQARWMMATIGRVGSTARTLCFSLCKEHADEVQEDFLLNFLAQKFGGVPPIQIVPIEQTDATARFARMALQELGCDLVKEDLPRQTFHGRRRASGFGVILRSHTEATDSYAYMILTPAGSTIKPKNVKRIDDAKDHPEQRFLWDHSHTALPQNNKDVKSSFTFGMPIADLKAIRYAIEEAEQGTW